MCLNHDIISRKRDFEDWSGIPRDPQLREETNIWQVSCAISGKWNYLMDS